MSDDRQTHPIMDGSEEATHDEKLAGLIEQVDNDRGDEGAEGMADELRTRMVETGIADDELDQPEN